MVLFKKLDLLISSLNLLKVKQFDWFQVLPIYPLSTFIYMCVYTNISNWKIIKLGDLQMKQQKQQLSVIHSLTELKKEVKEVLNVLGLLSRSTYSVSEVLLYTLSNASLLDVGNENFEAMLAGASWTGMCTSWTSTSGTTPPSSTWQLTYYYG